MHALVQEDECRLGASLSRTEYWGIYASISCRGQDREVKRLLFFVSDFQFVLCVGGVITDDASKVMSSITLRTFSGRPTRTAWLRHKVVLHPRTQSLRDQNPKAKYPRTSNKKTTQKTLQ